MFVNNPHSTHHVLLTKLCRFGLGGFLSLLILALGASTAVCQTGLGSITGRVADPSNAAVRNALVTVTNVDTGVKNSTRTNQSGIYNVLSLVPGNYSVMVSATGFETEAIEKVIVSTAQSVEINAALKMGEENITVTVTADDSLLTKDTSDVATTVDHELVENLPYPERSALEAILLVPGVNGDPLQPGGIATENPNAFTASVTPGASLTVGGTPPGGTSIVIDGSDVTQASFPRSGVNLSGREIQEASVIVAGLSAQWGRTGAGVIVMSSRSGTNTYHGALTWSHADPYFNATPFQSTVRSNNHQQFFGAYLGGPIRIPKIYNGKDKTFFFVGYEPARLRGRYTSRGIFMTQEDIAGHLNNSLPLLDGTILRKQGYAAALAAPRVGNTYYQYPTNANGVPQGALYPNGSYFQPITGPLADCGAAYAATNPSATTCPNDVAPQLAVNPFAQYVMSLLPTPSNPGPFVTFDSPDGASQTDGSNAVYQRGVVNKDDRYNIRIDHQFNNSNHLFVRYTVIPVGAARFFAVDPSNPINQTPTDNALTHDLAFGYTHVFSNNLVNVAHYSFLRVNQQRLAPPAAQTQDFAAKFGLTPASFGKGFPNLGNFNSNGINFTLGPGGANAQINIDQNFIGGDDLTWTHGKNLITFGFDIRWIQSNQYPLNGETGGSYQFSNNSTNNGAGAGGLALATFDLGIVSGFNNTPVSVPGYYRWHYYAGYVQDNYRVTPKMTLTAGLRYELELPRQEKFSNQAFVSLEPGTYNNLATSADFCFSNACNNGGTLFPPNYKGIEPRIGIAYAATQKMTIRASYALTRLPLSGAENIPDPNFNVGSASIGGVNGGVTPNQVVDYLTNPVGPTVSAYTLLAGRRGPFYIANGLTPVYVEQTSAVPNIQTYILSVQYQPFWRTLLQASYQGTKGTHLVGAFNQPKNVTDLSVVTNAIRTQMNLGQTLPVCAGGASAGCGNPYNVMSANNGTSGSTLSESLNSSLLPYQNFFNQALPEIYPRRGTLEYNAMYLSVNQRVSHGLTVMASYTWSKALDNIPDNNIGTNGGFGTSSPQNPFDMRSEWSVASFDQPSRFKAGYNERLPIGIGQRYHTGNGFVDRMIGGFSTSGMVSANSGYPNYVNLGSSGFFTSVTPQGTKGCLPNTLGSMKGNDFCVQNALPAGYTLRPNIVPGVPLINKNWKKNPFGIPALGPFTPYLNAEAFSVPGSLNNPQLGNASRTLGNARSPREFFFDMRIAKDFTIKRRYAVNVNANFNNVFNHPVYYGINNHSVFTTTVNASDVLTHGNINNVFVNTQQAAFSQIGASNTQSGSRTIRIGAEMTF